MYHGKEPFIFISYAHLDNSIVLPIISALEQKGFRIWYDTGIAPGSEWPEFIAQKILDCTVILVLLSDNALNSFNCKREINYALDKEKEMLVVHLEKANMTPGMEMQLNSNQAMYKYKFPDTESFLSMLFTASILQKCYVGESESKKDEEIKKTAVNETDIKEAPEIPVSETFNETPEIPSVADIITDNTAPASTDIPDLSLTEASVKVSSEKKEKEDILKNYEPADSSSVQTEEDCKTSEYSAESAEKPPVTEKEEKKAPAVQNDNTTYKTVPFSNNRGFTKYQVLSAVEYANKNKGDSCYISFSTGAKITPRQMTNATARFANNVPHGDILALLDTTILSSGKTGFLITKKGIYSSYDQNHSYPIYFSEIKEARLKDETHITILYKNRLEKDYFFNIYSRIIFSLIEYLI